MSKLHYYYFIILTLYFLKLNIFRLKAVLIYTKNLSMKPNMVFFDWLHNNLTQLMCLIINYLHKMRRSWWNQK